jgi:hypothetical protein
MKPLLLLLFCLSTTVYGQQTATSKVLFATNMEGEQIYGKTVIDVFNQNFKKDYQLSSFDGSFESQDGNKYTIVYQLFSYKPLYFVDIKENQLKNIPRVIVEFNKKYKNRARNIEGNYLLEYDIKEAIENKLTDGWFLNALGRPNSSYVSGDNYKTYSYDGLDKSIVLIFKNGIISDYIIHNGL